MKKQIYLAPEVEFLPAEFEEAIAMSDLNPKPKSEAFGYNEEEDWL